MVSVCKQAACFQPQRQYPAGADVLHSGVRGSVDPPPFLATKVADLSTIALMSGGGWIIPSARVCVSTALTLDKSGAGKLTDLAVPTATIAPGPGAGSAVPFATDKLAIPSFAELTERPPFSRDTILATPDHNPAALCVQSCAAVCSYCKFCLQIGIFKPPPAEERQVACRKPGCCFFSSAARERQPSPAL